MRRIALCLVALALAAGCGGDDDGSAREPATSTTTDATTTTSSSSDGVERADLDYDPSLPLEPSSEVLSTNEGGAVLERIEFTSFDGARVPGYFITDGEPGGACLIVQHGAGTDKEDGRGLGGVLRGRGVDVSLLTVDAREHGERRVDQFQGPQTAEAWARIVRETAIDLRRGLDYLVMRPECDPERIGILGISMGGFVGTLTAAVDERVQAVLLLSAGANYGILIRSETGLYSNLYRDDPAAAEAAIAVLDPVDPRHFVGDIAPRPLLMVNGAQDQLIVPESAAALHGAAGANSEAVWYQGGHSPGSQAGDAYQAMVDFLVTQLVQA